MSDTIQGARTRNYIKENVPGIQNSGDTLEYATVQEAPGKRGALDAVIHGSFTVSTGHAIETGSVKRLIKSTSHGAQKGWIMRPSSGLSKGEEIAIVKIVDANFFVISEEFDLAIADTFSICRLITPNYTEAGDLNVVVTASGPVQFIKDTVITTVEEDTAAPANNEPLPSKIFIQKDGVTYPVNKDTIFPSNTVSVPVEVTGASGPINITAGDLNVQLSDQGPNADVTRIGDGTNQWGINASTEGLVHDADAVTELGEINTEVTQINSKTPALGQALEAASTPVVLPVAQISALTPPAAITGFNLEITQLDVKAAVESLNTKLPAQGQALEAASTPVVLPVAQITALTPPAAITGFALEVTQLLIKAKTDNLDVALSTVSKEATLGLMSAKLPATLGTKTAALSLAVTPSSDGVFNTSQTPQGLSTFVTQVVTDAVVSTFTVPAGAKRMVVYNNADASGANRVRRGNVAVPPAWPSTGPLLGVGSFTSEIPATTFTVIAEDNSATANVSVEYFY